MIPALGERRVAELVAEQAARYATMTDEEIALSETPRFDASMREWGKRWASLTPEQRFRAHHGWPEDHKIGVKCSCSVCAEPEYLRRNWPLLNASSSERSAAWETMQKGREAR